MKQFTAETLFWDLFPEAKIGVVIIQGLDNRVKDPDQYRSLLAEAEE